MSTASNVISGGLAGAGTGAAIGSVIPGIGTAIGAAAGGLIGGIGGGLMGGSPKETRTQKMQRELTDQLLAGLKGQGQYANLFSANEADFNKSFRDPAMSMFKNQVTPQIQQGYIASGQQRGTGMEDTLARAGVDMDQLLNQHFAQFQENAMNRKTNAMNTLLGMGPGIADPLSTGQKAMQGLGGYMSSEGFGKAMGDLGGAIYDKRKGFEQDINDEIKPFTGTQQSYNYATGVQE
jgi:hypothetical protein